MCRTVHARVLAAAGAVWIIAVILALITPLVHARQTVQLIVIIAEVTAAADRAERVILMQRVRIRVAAHVLAIAGMPVRGLGGHVHAFLAVQG